MLDAIWNKRLAHHPLNWLILLVIAIMGMFLVDALHTMTGARKPVTEENQRRARNAGRARRNPNLNSGNAPDGYGTSDATPDSYIPS